MTYQSGITATGLSDHVFCEFDLLQPASKEVLAQVVAALDLPTTAGISLVFGVRPSLWQAVAPELAPANVSDFAQPIVGDAGYQMPATQHDFWLWIAAADKSLAYEATVFLFDQLKELATVATRTDGWQHANARDLTGFEDGTENPGVLSAPAVVEIPAGQKGAGASVLLYQHWQHLEQKWTALPDQEQEKVIGRTKADSIEFADDEQPENSHVSRTAFKVDGESMEIYRRNVAYQTAFGVPTTPSANAHGTVFVGFSFDQWRLAEMLRRMAGVGGPRDALTFFTEPVTGAYYVCPAPQDLLSLTA